MRNKAILAIGLGVGFIVGSRAGRERYDQLVRLGRKAADHPAVQNAKVTVTVKATDLTKTAAAKAPDLAKTAASAAKQAGQQAASRLPFTGKSGDSSDDAAEDISVPPQPEDSPATYNGVRAD